MATFVIRRGDRLPEIAATLRDATGAAVNLEGATVRFHMRPRRGGTPKVAAAGYVISTGGGRVGYAWSTADTDSAGEYYAEFEVTWPDGRVQTFPNLGSISVLVAPDVA